MKKNSYLLIIFFVGLFSISNGQSLTYKGFLDINASATNKHSEFNYGGFDNYVYQ